MASTRARVAGRSIDWAIDATTSCPCAPQGKAGTGSTASAAQRSASRRADQLRSALKPTMAPLSGFLKPLGDLRDCCVVDDTACLAHDVGTQRSPGGVIELPKARGELC